MGRTPLAALAALTVASCGGAGDACDGGCPDAVVIDARRVPRDAPFRDVPPRDVPPDRPVVPDPCELVPGARSGAACRDGVCAAPLECLGPLDDVVSPTPEPGGPACGDVVVGGLPGSMCARRCDPDGDGTECDPECERCSGAILAGRVRLGLPPGLGGICRPRCTPSRTGDGCEREGYACDVVTGTCMEACASDEQCSFGIGDPDGDGLGDIVCTPGVTCNRITGRCETPGAGDARAGDECLDDVECEDDGVCLDLAGGYCSRFGCEHPGFECDGEDEICDARAFGVGSFACLEACTVGSETTAAERRGAGGGSPTCRRPGMACSWNGTAASTDVPNGSCLPGNYNDEPAYDVGTACLVDGDCWSPFGYGRCLFTNALDRVASGVCAVGGCLGGTAGMPIGLLAGTDAIHAVDADVSAEICAAGDVCLNFGTTEVPTTFCVHTCDEAADCPLGYACPNLNTPDMPLFICWPFCQGDADCRAGATCRDMGGGGCGPGETGCTCSDAMPAPDAGRPDAG